MKNLTLVRHAKSSWKHPGLGDFERPLNKRGKRDAPLMGKYYKQNYNIPQCIISSPATRAITTCKIIASEIIFPNSSILEENSLYDADISDFIRVINNIDNQMEYAMIVGHNPTLTWLVDYLTGQYIDNIPTCGIVRIIFNITYWEEVDEGKGIFTSFDFPKKLERL